jgi:hypothetical protein
VAKAIDIIKRQGQHTITTFTPHLSRTTAGAC